MNCFSGNFICNTKNPIAKNKVITLCVETSSQWHSLKYSSTTTLYPFYFHLLQEVKKLFNYYRLTQINLSATSHSRDDLSDLIMAMYYHVHVCVQ